MKKIINKLTAEWLSTYEAAINREARYGYIHAADLYKEADAIRAKLDRLCKIAGV